MADWNPKAKKAVGQDAGSYTGGGAKVVLHTTEGSTAEGAIQAFRNTGSWPHFTISPTELYQHLPISKAARALEHPPGTCETNRDNCVQIEMVGFASQTQDWPAAYLARIGELCRWIETNHGVPSKATVKFTARSNKAAARLSCDQWHAYEGYVGHEHVPNNHHWDPGMFPIRKVLATVSPASSKLEVWKRELAKLRREAKKREKAGKSSWSLLMRVKARKLKALIAREEKKS